MIFAQVIRNYKMKKRELWSLFDLEPSESTDFCIYSRRIIKAPILHDR
jgi:hypothetical protein